MDLAEQSSLRQTLLREGIERIEVSVLKGLDLGQVDPVVLVLDPRDPLVQALIGPVVGPRKIEELFEEGRRRGKMPYLTWPLPKAIVARDLAPELPEVAEVIRMPAPEGGYWAVVLAGGGGEAFPMPRVL